MSTRVTQRGAVLLGCAGGMLVVAGALAASYYVVSTRRRTRDDGAPRRSCGASGRVDQQTHATGSTKALDALLAKSVDIKTGGSAARLTWAELGVEVDPDEIGRAGAGAVEADEGIAALAKHGSIPVRVDNDKAVKALLQLKARTDKSPSDAYLDLEERTIHDDAPGQGIDVFASLGRIRDRGIVKARRSSSSPRLMRCLQPSRRPASASTTSRR